MFLLEPDQYCNFWADAPSVLGSKSLLIYYIMEELGWIY